MFTVLCFFPNKWQKMNTVSQVESRTLLQYHSFKNNITLRPTWTIVLKSKLRKLSSVREFGTLQRPQPHFSVILFYFNFLVTWLKFQKHSKLGDKMVCSEVTEFIFFNERPHSITLSFEQSQEGLISKRKQCLCTCILRRSGGIRVFQFSGISRNSTPIFRALGPL